jgi:hypothetical protein
MDKLTFDTMLTKLEERENFSFQRWGDGEWNSVRGVCGRNCDGSQYYPEQGLALALCLLTDQFGYMGIQPFALKRMGAEISEWCQDNRCMVKWCDADIIHDASIADRIPEFVKVLKTRNVIFVGPERLSPIANKLRAAHVKVPMSKVWKWRSTIYSDIQEEIAHYGKDVVILYSMSMPTNTLIRQIYLEYGDTLTQISCGSVWDAYAGFQTRRYHKQIIERENA